MNPFENYNSDNQSYLEEQDRKLNECKQKIIELDAKIKDLDQQHTNLLFDWSKKTVFTKEFINFIKQNFPNIQAIFDY